jgi:hypothetical protein
VEDLVWLSERFPSRRFQGPDWLQEIQRPSGENFAPTGFTLTGVRNGAHGETIEAAAIV